MILRGRHKRPHGHIDVCSRNSLEQLAFDHGGQIIIGSDGWATLRNSRGSFCAPVPMVGAR